MKVGVITLTALFVIAAPAHAQAERSRIHGVVHVPPGSAESGRKPNPYPGRATSVQSREASRGLVSDAVIYVETLPAHVDSTLPKTTGSPTMEQRDQAFVPRVVAVAQGRTVTFPNRDPVFHNVFSVSPVKRFDLGRYVRGKSKSVTFPKTGLVNVYCEIHSDMAGFIMVTPTRAFAQPDSNGAYAIPPLPPGEYTVVAWHPDFKPVRRTVSVPVGLDVTLDLQF